MAGEKQDAVFPIPKFYFSVQFGHDVTACFQEVTGLSAEVEPIEYRHGNNPSFYPIKMPGITKFDNVTLKRGVVANDPKFWDWINETKLNTTKRRTVVINLLDEDGKPQMTWTLNNAWPIKFAGTDLKSGRNEVAIEELEIAYETVVVAAP